MPELDKSDWYFIIATALALLLGLGTIKNGYLWLRSQAARSTWFAGQIGMKTAIAVMTKSIQETRSAYRSSSVFIAYLVIDIFAAVFFALAAATVSRQFDGKWASAIAVSLAFFSGIRWAGVFVRCRNMLNFPNSTLAMIEAVAALLRKISLDQTQTEQAAVISLYLSDVSPADHFSTRVDKAVNAARFLAEGNVSGATVWFKGWETSMAAIDRNIDGAS